MPRRRAHPAQDTVVQGTDRWGALTPRLPKPPSQPNTPRFLAALPPGQGGLSNGGVGNSLASFDSILRSPPQTPMGQSMMSMSSMGMSMMSSNAGPATSVMSLPIHLSPRPPNHPSPHGDPSGRYSSMSMPAMWSAPPAASPRVSTPRSGRRSVARKVCPL